MSDVGRIMDKAAAADREALFSALQASLLELIEFSSLRRRTFDEALARIEERLDVGHPYGSEPGLDGEEKLTGDCEFDCQDACAYPGQFSECELGLTGGGNH